MYHPNPTASTAVYSGGPQVAYVPLNLAPQIGSVNRFAARLSQASPAAGGPPNPYFDMKPLDNAGTFYVGLQSLRGCSGARVPQGFANTTVMMTDPASTMGWRSSGAGGTYEQYLRGWYDVTPHNPTGAVPDILATSLPGTTLTAPNPWQMVDISPFTGATDTLSILQYDWALGTADDRSFYVRPMGGGLLPHRNNGYMPKGPSCSQMRSVQPSAILVPTDSAGRIEQAFWLFSSLAHISVHGIINDWVRTDIPYGSGIVPPPAFGIGNINLSVLVPGASSGVAFLEVSRPGAADIGVLQGVSFRAAGDVLDYSQGASALLAEPKGCQHAVLDAGENTYIDVEVGPTGQIEWLATTNAYPLDITVVGYVPAAVPPPLVGFGSRYFHTFYSWPQIGTPSTSFTGAPTSNIDATVTSMGRELFARAVVEGLAFEIREFGVGTDGYDPSDPGVIHQVDPEQTTLGNEVYRAPINLVNPLPSGSTEYYCRVDKNLARSQPLGELGLYAQITRSPAVPGEVGTWVLFAVGHEPMQVKTRNRVITKKVTLEL